MPRKPTPGELSIGNPPTLPDAVTYGYRYSAASAAAAARENRFQRIA
jgi:hypothetical protein